MTELYKKFLADDVRRLSPSGRFVGLAAFGKHPGWDDHVEDLGLETDSLNQAKIVFYVNGIGGQIDSGAWEKLDASQQLPGFAHLFLWQRSGQIILGRLWSSSDGKGRKRYPMVVCFHFAGISLRQALASGLPALAELEQQIQSTSSAEDVRSILNRKRAALRDSLGSNPGGGEYAPLSPDKLYTILHPPSDSASLGFTRVLYQMQSQFKTFAPGAFNPRASVRAQQIRVPAASANPEDAFLFWTRFFQTQIDNSVPLLFCLPLEGNWMDVTAGEPESHEFFALRASPKAVPLVSEVPYTLDDNFQSQARAFFDSFEKGQSPAAVVSSGDGSPAKSGSSSGRSGLLKWLGMGVVIIAAGLAAFVYLNKSKTEDHRLAGNTPVSTNSAGPSAATSVTSLPPAASRSDDSVRSASITTTSSPAQSAAAKPAEQKTVSSSPTQSTVQSAVSAVEKVVTQGITTVKTDFAPAEPVPAKTDTSATAPAVASAAVKQPEPPAVAEVKPVAFSAISNPPKETSPVEPSAPAAPKSGALMTNSIGMVFVLMPSGIWAGKYEVTRAEYGRLMEAAATDERSAALPVNRVSWDDASAFCSRLTQKESADLHGKSYALPTQKQWEELRAGQKIEELPAGALRSASQEPVLVSDTVSNKLGLYGVLGNVWEWCQDGGNDTGKLQKGGEYNSTSYERLVAGGKARLNSGFRVVLVQQ